MTKRANEYATPTHNARITKVYSVSFPLWIGGSQVSNVSRIGQMRQVSSAIVPMVRDAQDRMIFKYSAVNGGFRIVGSIRRWRVFCVSGGGHARREVADSGYGVLRYEHH